MDLDRRTLVKGGIGALFAGILSAFGVKESTAATSGSGEFGRIYSWLEAQKPRALFHMIHEAGYVDATKPVLTLADLDAILEKVEEAPSTILMSQESAANIRKLLTTKHQPIVEKSTTHYVKNDSGWDGIVLERYYLDFWEGGDGTRFKIEPLPRVRDSQEYMLAAYPPEIFRTKSMKDRYAYYKTLSYSQQDMMTIGWDNIVDILRRECDNFEVDYYTEKKSMTRVAEGGELPRPS